LKFLKGKLIKAIGIVTHVKLSKTYAFGTTNLKKNKNCNSYGLMKTWSNFNHSKFPNY
jgi:hypothetical protein